MMTSRAAQMMMRMMAMMIPAIMPALLGFVSFGVDAVVVVVASGSGVGGSVGFVTEP